MKMSPNVPGKKDIGDCDVNDATILEIYRNNLDNIDQRLSD